MTNLPDEYGNCGDIFSCFYEESDNATEAKAIIARLQNEMPPPEDGFRTPFMSLDRCSDAEKEVIKKFIEEEGNHAQQPATALTLPPADPVGHWGVFGFVREYLPFGKKKRSTDLSAYDAMMIVLRNVKLVYYEGLFYVQQCSIFKQISEPDLKTLIFGILEPTFDAGVNPKIVNAVVDALKMNGRIKVTQTSEDSDRVFFIDGAYSISKQQLMPIRPDDFFTTYVPIEFTPQHGGCPYFEQYLEQVSGGDEGIKRLIWEMIGYLLVPDMQAKAFFVLQGVGDSGKSVLGNLIRSLFNPESVSHMEIFRFRDRFATSGLKNKRLNVCMDLPRAQISREAIGTIKMVTGDDTITTEEKFRAAESYKPTCKLLFGSNFPLMPADNDEAFRARVVTIPFRYSIPPERQDKQLLEKLMGERLAIVMKALDYLQDLRARNYQFIRVAQTIDVTGYIPENELMAGFLKAYCIFESTAYTFTADLMEAYNIFRAGQNVPPLTDTATFSRQLNKYCAGRIAAKRLRHGVRNQNGYEGIRLKNFKEE